MSSQYVPPFAASSTNPLAAHFRTPGLAIKLPTNGAYLPEGTFKPDLQGMVPIYPMRASDEFALKNPDALMSGLAISNLLESCVPCITAPGLISSPDLDVIMLSIRIATYGEMMELSAICPKCQHENTFESHLPSLLATVKDIPTECPVRLNDELVAYLRPYNFNNATQMALVSFTETRRLQGLDPDMPDEKKNEEMQISMRKIAELETRITADCVTKIVTPTMEVTNPEHIAEFMSQTNRRFVRDIETHLAKINDSGMMKSTKVTCQNLECNHEWETSMEFDPASFFE